MMDHLAVPEEETTPSHGIVLRFAPESRRQEQLWSTSVRPWQAGANLRHHYYDPLTVNFQTYHLHDRPFRRTPQGGVEFDESKMEPHRPYPFQVDGAWLVAVRRSTRDGDVKLYELA